MAPSDYPVYRAWPPAGRKQQRRLTNTPGTERHALRRVTTPRASLPAAPLQECGHTRIREGGHGADEARSAALCPGRSPL